MAHYYRLDSSGEDTNLQLYSLRQARKYWQKLRADYTDTGEDTEDLKERCVFILATLGMSISQLLGQNDPSAGVKVGYPIDIFRKFVNHHSLDKKLLSDYDKFNKFYNGCRHFGQTTTGGGYSRVDELTYDVTTECYAFGLEVWKAVIGVYRGEQGADLDDFNMDELSDVDNEPGGEG